MLQETIEREFSVVVPVQLRVKNIRGSVDVRPGGYARINRLWSDGDRVSLKLDLRGRAVPAPSGLPQLYVPDTWKYLMCPHLEVRPTIPAEPAAR